MKDYLASCDEPRHDYPRCIMLHKNHLAAIMLALKNDYHWAFSLLRILPPGLFCIRKIFDFSRDMAAKQYEIPKIYSADEFLEEYQSMNRFDLFEVVMNRVTLTREGQFTLRGVMNFYTDYLYRQCEKNMRNNRPLKLTAPMAAKYELTTGDRRIVRRMLADFNKNVTIRLCREYQALSLLNCLEKQFPTQFDHLFDQIIK